MNKIMANKKLLATAKTTLQKQDVAASSNDPTSTSANDHDDNDDDSDDDAESINADALLHHVDNDEDVPTVANRPSDSTSLYQY